MWRSLVGLVCASLLTFACARKAETEKVAAPALPEGDPQAGKVAFQDLRCWACHEIYGGDMPKPVAQPPMPVYLGGNQIEAPSDIDPAWATTAA
jgi:mono/diheme cytochrome c family protein